MRQVAWFVMTGLILAATPAGAAYRIAASGRYVCADGSLAVISEQPYGTSLRHRGRDTQLSRRWAFSGFAYAGGDIRLRGRGEEGAKTLTITTAGAAVACQAVPAAATPGVATGTLAYRARIALPADAIVAVELRDTARADAAAPLLARTVLRPGGNQVPLHWRLTFDPRRIVHPARPSLSARITDAGGRLLWISDTFTPVPVTTNGSHAEADIRLVPAAP